MLRDRTIVTFLSCWLWWAERASGLPLSCTMQAHAHTQFQIYWGTHLPGIWQRHPVPAHDVLLTGVMSRFSSLPNIGQHSSLPIPQQLRGAKDLFWMNYFVFLRQLCQKFKLPSHNCEDSSQITPVNSLLEKLSYHLTRLWFELKMEIH